MRAIFLRKARVSFDMSVFTSPELIPIAHDGFMQEGGLGISLRHPMRSTSDSAGLAPLPRKWNIQL